MKRSLSESDIVAALADAAAKRICRKTIRSLQAMKATLSGDSELGTVWDEICVQIQGEQSYAWEVYVDTTRGEILGFLQGIPEYEKSAIWLQSNPGIDWVCSEADERDASPVIDDDIVDHVLTEYVYEEAGRWSNACIAAYLDRQAMTD
jgi:hypothetical protein